MSSTSTLNGQAQKPAQAIRLRFGNNCETYPGPILPEERIPIGVRNLTFDEIIKGHEKLLRQGLDRYGSRKEPYENNLHQARLALWNTIVSGASYREFRARFFKEMRRAARNDGNGAAFFERRALRLDSQDNSWHDMIPDRKASLNLHLMAKPTGRNPHYKITERADPRIAKARAKKRRRERREARWALMSEIWDRQREERIEASRTFNLLMMDHMWKIVTESAKQPFLMKPSMVLRILRQRVKIEKSYEVLRPDRNGIRTIRLLMGRVAPAVPEEVEQFDPKPLKPVEYEEVRTTIEKMERYYAHPMFEHITKYLSALRKTVEDSASMPEEIRKDLKKVGKAYGPPKEKEEVVG